MDIKGHGVSGKNPSTTRLDNTFEVQVLKILYVTEARLPTEKAHGIQISKTCEALSRAGADVTLIHPWRLQVNEDLKDKDAWTVYGIERNFSIVTLPCIDLLWLGLSNALLVMLTVGIYTPWAMCRTKRYHCSSTSLTPARG